MVVVRGPPPAPDLAEEEEEEEEGHMGAGTYSIPIGILMHFGGHWNHRTSGTYSMPIGILIVLESTDIIAPPEPIAFL